MSEQVKAATDEEIASWHTPGGRLWVEGIRWKPWASTIDKLSKAVARIESDGARIAELSTRMREVASSLEANATALRDKGKPEVARYIDNCAFWLKHYADAHGTAAVAKAEERAATKGKD